MKKQVKKFGPWRVIEKRPGGAQGRPFIVQRDDGSDPQRYVLKLLRNRHKGQRFRNEIEALKRLSHPHIIRIVDYSDSTRDLYHVSEYCEGGELANADLSRLSLLEKIKLFRTICEAVATAHSEDILHRDLKPENILRRGDGTLVVADFGIALDLSKLSSRCTRETEIVGPRVFIAPELEAGRAKQPTATLDTYSLGKLLYFIVSGRRLPREWHRRTDYNLLDPAGDTGMYFIYELLRQIDCGGPEPALSKRRRISQCFGWCHGKNRT